jgi:hypothetical protein
LTLTFLGPGFLLVLTLLLLQAIAIHLLSCAGRAWQLKRDSGRLYYLVGLFIFSTTVVCGFFLACDVLTNLPVFALLATLTVTTLLAIH